MGDSVDLHRRTFATKAFFRLVHGKHASVARSFVGFDSVLGDIETVEVTAGRLLTRYVVAESVSNMYGSLHASLVDTIGSAAFISTSDRLGVSVNLSCTYHAPAPVGKLLLIEATVLKAGRTLVTVQVDFRREDTGQLTATGLHTKFLDSKQPTWHSQAWSSDGYTAAAHTQPHTKLASKL
eukprot:gene27265-2519_t